MDNVDFRAKVSDACEAAAIGDACGLPFEFLPDAQQKDCLRGWEGGDWPDISRVFIRDNRFGRPQIRQGYYSDDTEHVLAALPLILRGTPTPDQLAEAFLREFETDLSRRGFPRHGHGSIMEFYEKALIDQTSDEGLASVRRAQKERRVPGNASVMRGWLAGVCEDVSRLRDVAYSLSDATHPHGDARQAGHAVALAFHYQLYKKKDNPDGLIRFVLDHLESGVTKALILQSLSLPSPDEASLDELQIVLGPQPVEAVPMNIQKQIGRVYGLNCWAPHTAATVLWLQRHSINTFDGIRKAIQLRGDTDSSASVVAALLSLEFGLASIPKKLLETQEFSRRRVEAILAAHV